MTGKRPPGSFHPPELRSVPVHGCAGLSFPRKAGGKQAQRVDALTHQAYQQAEPGMYGAPPETPAPEGHHFPDHGSTGLWFPRKVGGKQAQREYALTDEAYGQTGLGMYGAPPDAPTSEPCRVPDHGSTGLWFPRRAGGKLDALDSWKSSAVNQAAQAAGRRYGVWDESTDHHLGQPLGESSFLRKDK